MQLTGGRQVAVKRVFSLKMLIGSGDRIALFTLPFLVAGVVLNLLFPSFFAVGGPPAALFWVAVAVLVAGVIGWAWSVWLILAKVPRGELITVGPYTLVRHPLYTAVALLVVPAAGVLLNSWLGAVIGLVMYAAVRLFAPAEEVALARTFGSAWDEYVHRVVIRWL